MKFIKYVIILGSFFSLFWGVFAYLEEYLFCSIIGDNFTIYFNETDNTKKCNLYLNTLEQNMNQTYKELESIYRRIQNKQDVVYWSNLFKEKQQHFLFLEKYKNQLLWQIQNFEKMIFIKYKEKILLPIKLKEWELQYKINKFQWEINKTQDLFSGKQEWFSQEEMIEAKQLEDKISQLKDFKNLIESLQNADSLENLIVATKEYFTYQANINENRDY